MCGGRTHEIGVCAARTTPPWSPKGGEYWGAQGKPLRGRSAAETDMPGGTCSLNAKASSSLVLRGRLAKGCGGNRLCRAVGQNRRWLGVDRLGSHGLAQGGYVVFTVYHLEGACLDGCGRQGLPAPSTLHDRKHSQLLSLLQTPFQ